MKHFLCMVFSQLMVKLSKMLGISTLNSKQKRIYDWISEELRLPAYADVFGGAVIILGQRSPGYVTFVAHAGREIMNGLARAYRGDRQSQVQYVQDLDQIAIKWNDQWGASTGFSNTPEPSYHKIPHETCKLLKSLIDDHRAGRERSEEINEAFFSEFLEYRDEGDIPNNFVEEWKRTKKWFLEHAHTREKVFDADVETEIGKHFQHLESLLYVAARSPYSRIEELDEILDETNG